MMNKVKDATNAKVEYEDENRIIIQFFNNKFTKNVEFEK